MTGKTLKNFNDLNMKPGQMILGCMLTLQLICLFIMNLTMVTSRIDWDSANLFTHMIRMAEEKTYIIPGWLYTTSLEIDCSVLLAMPLYMLTGSIGLSVAFLYTYGSGSCKMNPFGYDFFLQTLSLSLITQECWITII